MEHTEVTVWVLVDAAGKAVADCRIEHLKDEYEADYGQEFDPATPARIVKLVLRVPRPGPVELAGDVPAEVQSGAELKLA